MSEKDSITNNNILKQYEDLPPINLVDTVERYYHTFIPNQNKDSLNILSTYKSKNNVKFQLIDFEFKKKLSPILQPKIKNIQTMKIYGDYFFFIRYIRLNIHVLSISRVRNQSNDPPG